MLLSIPLLCSIAYTQSTLTFDTTYFSKYEKNFIPYYKDCAPAYVFEPHTHLHNYPYPQLNYAILDSLELYDQSKAIVYVLSDSPENPNDPYFVYYMAVFKMENGTLRSTAENFKLVEQNTSHLTTVQEFTRSDLESGSYIRSYNADGVVTIQQIFQLVTTPIIFPPTNPYPPCIIPPYIWDINPDLYRCLLIPINCTLTTVCEAPKAPPFDVNAYLKTESKYHFYRTALQLPYGVYSTRQSKVELGLYRLSDVILTAKLKEISETIHKNKKA